jgi:hypothetical protein
LIAFALGASGEKGESFMQANVFGVTTEVAKSGECAVLTVFARDDF